MFWQTVDMDFSLSKTIQQFVGCPGKMVTYVVHMSTVRQVIIQQFVGCPGKMVTYVVHMSTVSETGDTGGSVA